jgi:hypothetical protein
MGYCKDDWVSDFGWNITFWFIRLLGMFPQEGGDAMEPVLVGSIDPDGTQHWYPSRGQVGAEGEASIRWRSEDGTVVTAPARITPRPHGDTVNVVARWPGVGPVPDRVDVSTSR